MREKKGKLWGDLLLFYEHRERTDFNEGMEGQEMERETQWRGDLTECFPST